MPTPRRVDLPPPPGEGGPPENSPEARRRDIRRWSEALRVSDAEAAAALVEERGVVQAARPGPGDLLTLADAVAGEPIEGSWWEHVRSHTIFEILREVRARKDVLTCRLLEGRGDVRARASVAPVRRRRPRSGIPGRSRGRPRRGGEETPRPGPGPQGDPDRRARRSALGEGPGRDRPSSPHSRTRSARGPRQARRVPLAFGKSAPGSRSAGVGADVSAGFA